MGSPYVLKLANSLSMNKRSLDLFQMDHHIGRVNDLSRYSLRV